MVYSTAIDLFLRSMIAKALAYSIDDVLAPPTVNKSDQLLGFKASVFLFLMIGVVIESGL
jgi:hypothetical protein